MNRLNLRQGLIAFTAVGAVIAFAACLTVGAQTTTPEKKVTTPAKAAAVKPVAKATSARTAATQKTQTAATAVTPASSQTVITPSPQTVVTPSSQTGAAPLSQTGLMPSTAGTAAGTSYPASGMSSAGTSSNTPSSAGDNRAPVGGQGVGTFLFHTWTLVAYGCFRSGTRLFCDFDTFNQNNLEAKTNIWEPVSLVDDGGKITRRHNAFFVGDDGSQFPTAYITTKPVRFIIEYDNIDQRYSSISLVLGRDQISGVPITVEDASQAAGTIPARPTSSAVRSR